MSPGSYAVSYTPTKSGNYEAGVKLAKSGGLTGQYFENVWFFYTPVKTVVNPTINLGARISLLSFMHPDVSSRNSRSALLTTGVLQSGDWGQ